MAQKKLIYYGSTKSIYEGKTAGTYILHFRDDTVAAENNEPFTLEGKGVLNNRLSEHIMAGLKIIGVPTHFLHRVNMREQLIRSAEILPLLISVKNYATGSLSKRFGLVEGSLLPRPIIEYRLKDQDLDNPLITEDQILAFNWASQFDLEDILPIAFRTNDFLTGMMLGVNICLAEFTFEIGRIWEDERQKLVIVDELSPDVCRLWDAKTGESLGNDDRDGGSNRLPNSHTEVAMRLGVLSDRGIRKSQGEGRLSIFEN